MKYILTILLISTICYGQDGGFLRPFISPYDVNPAQLGYNIVTYDSVLSDAVSAISTNQATLTIAVPCTVSTSTTVPENITLYFMRDGSLFVTSGDTLTINGEIIAGLDSIFLGTGVLDIDGSKTKEVYPEWWGLSVGEKLYLSGATWDDTLTTRRGAFIKGSRGYDSLDFGRKLSWQKVDRASSCTATLVAEAGNIDAGNHYYAVTFVTSLGETDNPPEGGNYSNTITADGGHGKVQLTNIPTGTSIVTGRKIYRNKVTGNTYTLYLLDTLNDNTTTTYLDNVADASLGTDVCPGNNTTGGFLLSDSKPYGFLGESNIGMGDSSLTNNTSGRQNTALGQYTLKENTTAHQQTAIGANTLQSATTGSFNTGLGAQNLVANTTGEENTAVGVNNLYYNISGNSNNALGVGALFLNTTGSWNCGFGSAALQWNTTGHGNTAIGTEAMMGDVADPAHTGSYNVAVGYDALFHNASGNYNIGIGYSALVSNSLDSSNIGIGRYSYGLLNGGSGNIGIGTYSGRTLTTGNYNIFIGDGAGYTYQSDGVDNSIAIGYNSYTTASNTIVLGNSLHQTCIGTTTPLGLLTVAGNAVFGRNDTLDFENQILTDATHNAIVRLNPYSSYNFTFGNYYVGGARKFQIRTNNGTAIFSSGSADETPVYFQDKIVIGDDQSENNLQGIYWDNSFTGNYGIYRKTGVWTQPLSVNWYTGIEFWTGSSSYDFIFTNGDVGIHTTADSNFTVGGSGHFTTNLKVDGRFTCASGAIPIAAVTDLQDSITNHYTKAESDARYATASHNHDSVYAKLIGASDIEITNTAKGLVLRSASHRWRLTIDDSGTIVITDLGAY